MYSETEDVICALAENAESVCRAYLPAGRRETAHALDELRLYGYRPFDEPDPRPMPDADRLRGAVADIFDALAATLEDTRMEPDLEEVLWGQVNLFHRATARIERSLDENEQAQRRLQREQDGSEVTAKRGMTSSSFVMRALPCCAASWKDRPMPSKLSLTASRRWRTGSSS